MGWELRRGTLIYYRKERDGRRVRSIYCGSGERGEAAAREDEEQRAARLARATVTPTPRPAAPSLKPAAPPVAAHPPAPRPSPRFVLPLRGMGRPLGAAPHPRNAAPRPRDYEAWRALLLHGRGCVCETCRRLRSLQS